MVHLQLLLTYKNPQSASKKIKTSRTAVSQKIMEDVCKHISQKLQQNHGYHRGCYQKFTKTLNRLAKEDIPSASGSQCRSTRSSASQKPESIIFNPDCVFCNMEGKIHVAQGGSRTTQGTSSFVRDGWQRILKVAQENQHHCNLGF